MREDSCLLCRVVRGELQAKTVLETERAVAVINTLEPHARGHVVVRGATHGPEL
jgi:diadenosine tetraphosphate (Ap4A) HIT family hydrolase